ncbi:hypothetical protein [Natronorarus salvus]|uniref:hypothetical protein n=1 Tax=Natronorarus salvus TaxID=3117733 RepID=UPI002F26C687
MSQEVDEYERLTVEEEGVSVEKRFEPEAFAVPTITFTIDSEREDPATIRLVDEVPEAFPIEKIGFHPEYESECWSAYEDSRVAFERTLEAGEFVSTVYAIRIDDPEEARPFMVAPSLDVESGSVSMEREEPLVSEETTAVVREFIDGSRESVPGLDEEEGGSLDERLAAVEGGAGETAVELEEPQESVESPPESVPPVDEPEENEPAPTADSERNAVASLAAEIREGTASETDLAVLREAVELSETSSSSTDAQLSHLQARVSELDAYADAFSAFVDENGTGEELLEQSRSRHDEIEASLANLESRVEELSELEGEIESVEETVRELEAPIDELRGKLVGVKSDVAAVEADVDELDAGLPERIAAVRVEIEEVQESVDEIESWREQLGEMFTG